MLPVRPGEISDAGIRQAQDKLFYVSPFVEMMMRHHFRISPPGAMVRPKNPLEYFRKLRFHQKATSVRDYGLPAGGARG